VKKNNPDMGAEQVIEFVELLTDHGIVVYVDGGWGVDALLARQTRPHSDLDIAVQHKDVAQIRALLAARGYKEVSRDDSWECNFVLGDDDGHLIDIHSFTFDKDGNNLFGVKYPYDSLKGTGSISAFPVKCITPEWMVKFHSGYKLDVNDYHDVKNLCRQYGFELPAEYADFALKDDELSTQELQS
jgi:lincosamide nucleotidyltransferase A/C/D/E